MSGEVEDMFRLFGVRNINEPDDKICEISLPLTYSEKKCQYVLPSMALNDCRKKCPCL